MASPSPHDQADLGPDHRIGRFTCVTGFSQARARPTLIFLRQMENAPIATGTAQTNPNLTKPTGNPATLATRPARKITKGTIDHGGRGATGRGDAVHSFHHRRRQPSSFVQPGKAWR
jgi:hypothetical protein